ncbi:hypothetical protein GCM10007301_22490 [Azorhizobium oxalatiphilum]|uniref:Uncharacterized protein n=1 Tax=Azorhizobium oxalatiphilum TaxID=980631 RepID=A0A917FCJ3_9HYPH|nr:SbcC/MukB-like Walker B domain-containing protein [Azorhizobium oxalatiphilum]GGF62237.1 hypothetical protein GCM10007301_22490 [Azorhizobium oxalatiphilum]
MMHLSRISLVQWHLFGREDLDLVGDAAILGKNRSGKSTLIDLIQAVMSGGSARYHKFNRSAGESGSRGSERTLRSYCLGQLGEGEYQREASITHIALGFEDPDGLRPPVSIGLCIEASAQEEAQIVGRYVTPGVLISTASFVERLESGHDRAASWSFTRRSLEDQCAAVGTELAKPDSARNFIREYMRHLFTGRRPADPERFVRAFVMALSFEDMRSVDHFVHQFLLEKKDIDIGDLRDSIRRYQDIQKDIRELERRLEALREIRALVTEYEDLLAREETRRGVSLLARAIEGGSALLAVLRKRKESRRAQEETARQLERHADELRTLTEEAESLQDQLAAQDAASQRSVVSSSLRLAEQERNVAVERLRVRYLAAARSVTLLDSGERLASLRMGEVMRTLEAVKARSDGLVPPAWPRNPNEMEGLLEACRDAARAALPRIVDRRDEAIYQARVLLGEMRELEQRREQARTGSVALEGTTLRLMAALEQAGMRPRALCQVVEIADESWRDAAEAFFGRNREAILVEPEHASRAVEILRAGRDQYRGCRVANTRRLAKLPREASKGTLAGVIASDDPLAQAFVVFHAGSVALAETQANLMGDGRAIMRDGAFNSGIVVEVLRARDLKLGRAAAPLMEEGLRRQIDEVGALLKAHRDAEKFHADIARRLDDLAQEIKPEERLDVLTAEIARRDEQREELQARLEQISATIDPSLRKALDTNKVRRSELEKSQAELLDRRGRLTAEVASLDDKLRGAHELLGSWNCWRWRWSRFRERVRNRDQLELLKATYRTRGGDSLSQFARDMDKEAAESREEHRACEGEIREAHGRFRLLDENAPHVLPGQVIAVMKPWVVEAIEALETNELIMYRRQADEAAQQVVRIFRTAFVHELNARFSGMRTEIDALNRSLKSRPLHNEIYSLQVRPKASFEELYRLARESEENEDLLDLLFAGEKPRDAAHANALAEVERLLGDQEMDFSAYQDYRSYFDFDLRMQDVNGTRSTSFDRRRGVASGAERQVPYYVIIGAALSSIYHGAGKQFALTDRGVGLAVFDEAFSKMDGPNQRTLLDFYDDIGLQVVIAAPSEKRSVVYENLDSIVDVFRHGDQATAECARIKPHARVQMRAANPQHLSEEDLGDLLDVSEAPGAAE